MIYFTSDTHFYHNNIIKHCSRPFNDLDEMHDVMFDNINSVVNRDDVLYHLGDFSMGGFRKWEECRSRIRCKDVHIVKGNHDKQLKKSRFKSLFSSVDNLMLLRHDNEIIVMSHYSMRVWPHKHHGAWQLYGHSHGTLPAASYDLAHDVGVDANSFKPISFNDVRAIMEVRKDYFESSARHW